MLSRPNTVTPTPLLIEHIGSSLTGVRDENQDAILIKIPDNPHELEHKGIVACIADGVSCSSQSQKASHTAVVQFINDYYATPNSWSIKKSAGKILTSLNSWLFEESEKQGLSHNALVTTFSCLIFKSNTVHIFHVGDTRIYRLRNNKLQPLTKDHQRTNFGKAAYLTRALGMDSKLDIDYQALSLHVDDRFILTTDGVHDFVSAPALTQIARDCFQSETQDCSAELCQMALNNGSQDNLSCLILAVSQLPQHSLLEHQQLILSRVIPPAMRIGQTIDGYRIDKILYEGSRSHVYQVTELASNQKRVLKAPSENFRDDRDYLINFANEAWVGSQLASPRVMKIFAPPANTHFVYQVCEYIEGITLRQWMYDNPKPSLASVRALLDEIIKAVRVLQRAEMVHRDLKPENIMLTHSGTIKIIDLGSVQVQGFEEMQLSQTDTLPLGAVNYIAPEYLLNNQATTLSDLFSVAVIGYEMLTAELPYKAINHQNLQAARHTQWHYRSILDYRDDLPHWIDLTFHKATHHLANRRYQALSEFIADLYTPNTSLQKEGQARPLIQRNPVKFWKAVAIIATTIALVEFIMLM